MEQFTRQQVIDIIEAILLHGDAVIDAITSEAPKNDPEDLLEMAEYYLENQRD